MFSGIVAGQGELLEVQPSASGVRIRVRYRGLKLWEATSCRRVKVGDSVAVNGCCLTAISNRTGVLEFDILRETWNRTVLHRARVPCRVNLETSLCAGDPIGGHFVTGHIDGIGRITSWGRKGADVLLEIEPPRGFMRWIVMKGSVAIDGVSLTIAGVTRSRFSVWLIPHTLHLTTLGWKRKNDCVNLEGDMLAKYAQKAMCSP